MGIAAPAAPSKSTHASRTSLPRSIDEHQDSQGHPSRQGSLSQSNVSIDNVLGSDKGSKKSLTLLGGGVGPKRGSDHEGSSVASWQTRYISQNRAQYDDNPQQITCLILGI
ncbi:hypothetical protein SK128_022943 [Halocaridina rubra]|uniref:Uncharacterized protein n=1 Tax=Halocaridina rubra TaxID=373956 RepID=A0AAN8WLS3_HALRR